MHRFPFDIEVPTKAPFSIDLDDNDLKWNATLRIDIPRWPDWIKDIPIQVVPSGKHDSNAIPQQSDSKPATEMSNRTDSGITFAETAQHLFSVRDDRDSLEDLVEAVTGLSFQLEAIVERRLLYAGDEDPHVYKGGHAVWAHFTDPELPMVLYVPRNWGDDFEQASREVCRGRGTIVGWDRLHERLQIKMESHS